MLRRSPLRPGKGLKPGGPLQVRTRLERGPGPKRKTKLRQRNPARLAKLRAQQFAEQSDICRALPCLLCSAPPPSEPHHASARGMGGVKGLDRHVIPLCTVHHRAVETEGLSRHPVSHRMVADLIHNLLTLLLPAEMPEEDIP